MTVDIGQAVRAATEFAIGAYSAERVLDPMLEEIASSDDDESWLITLSWADPDRQPELVRSLGRMGGWSRTYRVFHVHRETGKVAAMKIREVGAES